MIDADLNYVETVEEAAEALAWLDQPRKALSIDTETTGLKWDADVRLIQFGDVNGGYAVPIREWRGVAEAMLNKAVDSGVPIVMHNAGYDQARLRFNEYPEVPWPQVSCTEIMHRTMYPHLRAGLKAVCDRYWPGASAGQVLLKEKMRANRWDWATVPTSTEEYWQYGVLDVVLTARLYDTLRADPSFSQTAFDREMAVRDILSQAEFRGVRIDPEYTTRLLSEWRAEREELRRTLQAAGLDNPGSNPQVTHALKDAGWQPEEFTETGQPKLDKAILRALDDRFPGIALPLLRYRRLTKWSSAYLEAFLREQDANGRIHPSIRTQGARTGRMSVTDPAFQTLPSGESAIRNCILPYQDDHDLYACDFSNVEMRIFASYTGDPLLIDAAKAEDFHRSTAALVFGISEAEVSPAQRSLAKTVNFANVYGAGPAKMAEQAGVSEGVIKDFLAAFNSRFPKADQFKFDVQTAGKRRTAEEDEGYIVTSGGRRLVCDSDKIYSLTNYICQGSAADVFKDSLIALDSAGLGDFIVLPVHDEVLFSFPRDEAPHLAKIAQEAMNDYTTFAVPLTTEMSGPYQRWGDGYAS